MSNKAQSGGENADLIIGIIALVIMIIIFKYIWQGVTWAFAEYVNLLHVN